MSGAGQRLSANTLRDAIRLDRIHSLHSRRSPKARRTRMPHPWPLAVRSAVRATHRSHRAGSVKPDQCAAARSTRRRRCASMLKYSFHDAHAVGIMQPANLCAASSIRSCLLRRCSTKLSAQKRHALWSRCWRHLAIEVVRRHAVLAATVSAIQPATSAWLRMRKRTARCASRRAAAEPLTSAHVFHPFLRPPAARNRMQVLAKRASDRLAVDAQACTMRRSSRAS